MLLSSFPAYELLRNGDLSYFEVEAYDLWLLAAGAVVMAAALLPRLLSKRIITAPIIYLLIGILAYFLLPVSGRPDLVDELWWVKRLTEMVVIIALTSAGLKLNKPFAKATWIHSKRLLGIGMPITMLLTFVLGYWLFDFALATAALLAAVIAPTDPVLASEVQTTSPTGSDSSATRVALTAEAGINDGLAFPFTYLAMGLAVFGIEDGQWLWSWFLMDFVYKIVVGIAVGWAMGWLLNRALIYLSAKNYTAKVTIGILALSLTLIPYGLAEIVSAYGFVAVFVAACVFRNLEAQHEYQEQLHNFAEEVEHILVAIIFVLLGIYVVGDLDEALTWAHVGFSAVLIFAVRPIAGYMSLAGMKLKPIQKFTMSFFGIRGIGSLYYLSYAMYHESFPHAEEAFALVVFLIVLSAVVHGLSAGAVVTRLERDE